MVDKWKPRPSDVEWARDLILILKDGGGWGNSFGIYKLDKKEKTLMLIEVFDERWRETIHDRSIKVFAELGWKVVDDTKKGKEEA
jgi:hypothetical protein